MVGKGKLAEVCARRRYGCVGGRGVRLGALRRCGRGEKVAEVCAWGRYGGAEGEEGGRGVRLGALRGILKEIQDIWAIGLDEVLDYWFESLGYFVAGFGFFERCLNKVGCVLEKNIIESGIACQHVLMPSFLLQFEPGLQLLLL